MSNYAVIASGQSLTDIDCEKVRNAKIDGIIDGVISVSNVGIDRYVDASALVSHDFSWWDAHPEAQGFKGRKFSKNGSNRTEPYDPKITGCNSGLMAMMIARDIYGAKKLALLGFDMHGTHYFGKHTRKKLINTDDRRFKVHIDQFNGFTGCEVYNCSPGSRLNKFPKICLEDILEKWKSERA